MPTLNPIFTRRSALKAIGALGAGATFSSLPSILGAEPAPSDADIFNFALNLESLETEYYLRGTTGRGMDAADAGSNPGTVNGGRMVPWQNQDLKQFMEEIAGNELAHVRFYRRVLGPAAVSRPKIDIAGGFAAAAKAAGLGNNFDPFASEMNFFLGGMLMEDVGVTAYHGAVTALRTKEHQDAAAGILAVEAYHMGMARSTLYRMGPAARHAANAISDARDKLDGPADLDQGIEMNGHANFVPSDADAKAFSRTPQQVLRIVYLTDKSGVSGGGIFPNGMNGAIRTT
ncbi:MAG TPA: ferritin-like domain-containing protein [Gemmatimonadaceae bacterium]|nr:ferritin-like domain-containing protein [Gemmatimonadaceae bacterium]